MKTVEIIGYRRANLGKNDAQKVREEGHVPCVLYGGDSQVHFYAPVILFRDLVYTNEAHFVHLNIEGEECQAIMQEVQFHPVSEIILHVDFLRISEDRKIKMDIPTRLVGLSPGVAKGFNDLSDQLEHFIKRAIQEPDATVYAFGQRRGPRAADAGQNLQLPALFFSSETIFLNKQINKA